MGINSHRCSYCNEIRSTVLIDISTDKPSNVFVDANTRYLCYYCIKENVANIKFFVVKVLYSGKHELRPPFGYTPLLFKGDEFVYRPERYNVEDKCFECFVEPGEYICLALGGRKPKRRLKPEIATPLFGETLPVDNSGMKEFDAAQGHIGKRSSFHKYN